MTFDALATDYDGTIASQGVVDDRTLAALDRLRASGRRLLMVTGREVPSLERAFAYVDHFDLVVAENGALLYWPATRKQESLAEPPSAALVEALARAGVEPLRVGRSIVATTEPNEAVVREALKALRLELQVILNKGEVMVLPTGVDKATGLAAALQALGVRPERVVGVGDAENDHAFLAMCGCSVAVGNALPAVKERAHFTTEATHGAGVAQLIDRWLTIGLDDLVA